MGIRLRPRMDIQRRLEDRARVRNQAAPLTDQRRQEKPMPSDSTHMNIIDRLIAFFAPSAALRRIQARQALAELAEPQQPAVNSGRSHTPARRDDGEGWRRVGDEGLAGEYSWLSRPR